MQLATERQVIATGIKRDVSSLLPELRLLWNESIGDPEITVAVLDGPVDLSHPCFEGSNLKRVETLVSDEEGADGMSIHGTHVTSLIFGRPDGPVPGIAPRCRGLILPVFRDYNHGRLSQLDLARAIEQAVQHGAQIINISGGERSSNGQADHLLAHALKLCAEANVLVVAATGNDACECVHVPAAFPSVLAVGALGDDGKPLLSSNWGSSYKANGILAPGENIAGAIPGGGIASLSGSSFATPIVCGVAALLLSIQRQRGEPPNPRAVCEAILNSAWRCDQSTTSDCARHLAGILNIPGAYALINKGEKKMTPNADLTPAAPQIGEAVTVQTTATDGLTSAAGIVPAALEPSCASMATGAAEQPSRNPIARVAVEPSQEGGVSGCGCARNKSNVFFIGTLNFDFGTEARRDTFRQLMDSTSDTPANAYDPIQLAAYLEQNPWDSTELIWTLMLNASPVYAVVAEERYASDVYKFFRDTLKNEFLPRTDSNYVERMSIAGVITNRNVRLFSGQTVPVIQTTPRGLYRWNPTALIDQVIASVGPKADTQWIKASIRNFLNKVYYELRNLGQTSQDRAQNFAVTNVFQFASGISQVLQSQPRGGDLAKALNPKDLVPPPDDAVQLYTFDNISVTKSPFCRMDSDCWDVQVIFFNPQNVLKANIVVQFTIDVSDKMPVTVGETQMWTARG